MSNPYAAQALLRKVMPAAEAAADALIATTGFGLPNHCTCAEAEAFAGLIRAVRSEEEADAFLYDHCLSDEEGDDPTHLQRITPDPEGAFSDE